MTRSRTTAKILSWALSAALISGCLPLSAVEAAAQSVNAAAGAVSGVAPVPGMVAPSLGGSMGLNSASQGLGQLSSPANGGLPSLAAPQSVPTAAAVSQAAPSVVSPAVAGAHPVVAVSQAAPAATAVSRVSPSAVSPAVAGAHPQSAPAAAAVSKAAPSALSPAVVGARPVVAVSRAGPAAKASSQDSSLAALEQTGSQLSKPGVSAASTLSGLYEGAPRGEGSASPAAVQGLQGRAKPRRLSLLQKAIGATAVVVPTVSLIAGPLVFGSAHGAGLFSQATDLLAQAGNIVGNGLAIYMPIPQVHLTARQGHRFGTPLGRALLMIGASLALGMINAPIAGNLFWGVQNIFGAVVMLSTIPIRAWLQRRGEGLALSKPADPSWSQGRIWLHHLLYDRGLHLTLATVAVSVPLSIGMYLAAAAFVPGLLASILPAAVTIPMVTLAVQALTGLMFLMMFMPDVFALLRGKPSESFTPGFSLSFSAASVGFVVWSLHAALLHPALSATWWQFMIYTAVNAVYALVSFASYRVAVRNARKTAA